MPSSFHNVFEDVSVAQHATAMSGNKASVHSSCVSPSSATVDMETQCLTDPVSNIAAHEMVSSYSARLCDVTLDPPVLLFSSSILRQTKVARTVDLRNFSSVATCFSWHRQGPPSDTTVDVEPVCGSIGPGEVVSVTVTTMTSRAGPFEKLLRCDIENSSPLLLQVCGDCKGAEVRIQEPMVDFGLIRAGQEAEFKLNLENISNTFAEFSCYCNVETETCNRSSRNFLEEEVKFEPSSGIIQPLSTHCLSIKLLAGPPRRFRGVIECRVKDGASQYVVIKAEIQYPQVTVEPLEMDLGKVYTGVPVPPRFLTLRNLTNIASMFHWEELTLAGQLVATFDPPCGIVPPKGEVRIEFNICCEATDPNMEILFSCDIEGMEGPVGFVVYAEVYGLEVSYRLAALESQIFYSRPLSSAPLRPRSELSSRLSSRPGTAHQSLTGNDAAPPMPPPLDFGSAAIAQRCKSKFFLKNESGSFSTFRLQFQKFGDAQNHFEFNAPSPSSPNTRSPSGLSMSAMIELEATNDQEQEIHMSTSKRNKFLLTNKYESTARFQSRAGRDFLQTRDTRLQHKQQLSSDQGCSFQAIPAAGQLAPWQEIEIEVFAVSDMCGSYEDVLTSYVDGLEPVHLPVSLHVKGSPISLLQHQVGLQMKTPTPLLEFSQILFGAASVQKPLRVQNTGPVDIIVSWRLFNYASLALGDDDRDLVCVNFDPPSPADYASDGVHVSFVPLSPSESSEPFSISPKQQVIKARSQATFHVSFCSEHAGEHRSFLLSSAQVVGASNELDNAEIKVDLHASSVVPALRIDKKVHYDGKQYMKFDLWPVDRDKVPDAPIPLKSLSLYNDSSTALTFAVDLEGPFSLIALATNSTAKQLPNKKSSTWNATALQSLATPTKDYTLQPREELLVSIRFEPRTSDIRSTLNQTKKPLDALRSTLHAPTETSNNLLRSTHVGTANLCPQYKGLLTMKFSNGHTQELHLKGVVSMPAVQVTPREVHFEHVHVEHSKQFVVHLTNPTPVHAQWQLFHVAVPKSVKSLGEGLPFTTLKKEKEVLDSVDDASVFQFTVTGGTLLGPSTPLLPAPLGPALPTRLKTEREKMKDPQAIIITFRPKNNVAYRSTFRFSVLGGQSVDILLSGTGSVNEEVDDQL
eukprot:GILK01003399.1.p1 GENE.GILK01003399.1~~GILK01003399.1.p1  ORF type:complete len:1158 (+),score=156.82 GILK01003399.1:52-3474(+)